jgi:hypothetical protein
VTQPCCCANGEVDQLHDHVDSRSKGPLENKLDKSVLFNYVMADAQARKTPTETYPARATLDQGARNYGRIPCATLYR